MAAASPCLGGSLGCSGTHSLCTPSCCSAAMLSQDTAPFPEGTAASLLPLPCCPAAGPAHSQDKDGLLVGTCTNLLSKALSSLFSGCKPESFGGDLPWAKGMVFFRLLF